MHDFIDHFVYTNYYEFLSMYAYVFVSVFTFTWWPIIQARSCIFGSGFSFIHMCDNSYIHFRLSFDSYKYLFISISFVLSGEQACLK